MSELPPGRCPVCASDLAGLPVPCPRCGTLHHAECWGYAGGCARYGCTPAPPEARTPAVRPPAPVAPPGLAGPAWILGADLGAVLGEGLGRSLAWIRGWLYRSADLPAVLWHGLGFALLFVLWVLFMLPGIKSFVAGPAASVLPPLLFWTLAAAGLLLLFGGQAMPHLLTVLTVRESHRLARPRSRKELVARLAERPDHPALLEACGFALFEAGDLDAAETAFNRLQALEPRSQLAALYRARILGRRGRPEAMLALLTRAIGWAPGSALAPRLRWWCGRGEGLSAGAGRRPGPRRGSGPGGSAGNRRSG